MKNGMGTDSILEKVKPGAVFSSMRKIIDGGLILLDTEFNSIYVNEKAKIIFGIHPDEELRYEDELSFIGPLLKEFGTFSGDFLQKELRLNIPGTEKEKVIRTLSAPIMSNGKKEGYVIFLSDVTSQKERERLQSEFVSHVSHEMRTPLTVMKEFSDILMDGLGGELNPSQKEYLAIIRNNIERLTKIVAGLLDVSKLEAGKVKLNREIANIKRLIGQLIYMLKPHSEKRKIKLIYEPEADIALARIDVDKMSQVLINLIENGFKYTPEGGSITVRARDTDDSVEVSVSDTGIGISLEDKEKVFDKFYQIGLKAGPGSKGIGLGLAITKEIVTMHGGKIRVDSIPGKGSTFTLTLPAIGKIKDLSGYVTECIDFADVMGKNFTLLRMTVENIKQYEKSGVKESTLLQIHNSLQNELRKATDSDPIAIKDSFFIGLPGTDKKQAAILTERLQKAINSNEKLKLRFVFATYPEDASASEEIIKKCLKKG